MRKFNFNRINYFFLFSLFALSLYSCFQQEQRDEPNQLDSSFLDEDKTKKNTDKNYSTKSNFYPGKAGEKKINSLENESTLDNMTDDSIKPNHVNRPIHHFLSIGVGAAYQSIEGELSSNISDSVENVINLDYRLIASVYRNFGIGAHFFYTLGTSRQWGNSHFVGGGLILGLLLPNVYWMSSIQISFPPQGLSQGSIIGMPISTGVYLRLNPKYGVELNYRFSLYFLESESSNGQATSMLLHHQLLLNLTFKFGQNR